MSTQLICHDPEIYLLSTPFPNGFLSNTNCYVVHDGADWLVVDSGYPDVSVLETLLVELEEIGIDWNRTASFVTHLHHDHIGLVNDIIPAGARVYLGARSCERFRTAGGLSDAGRSTGIHERFLAEGASEAEARAFTRIFEARLGLDAARYDVRLVGEGDSITVGQHRLEVIDISGHALGHLGLYEPVSQTLFCGDHILAEVSPSIAPGCAGYDALGSYLDNLRKVQEMPIACLAWGHGRLPDDHRARVRHLIVHHEERIEEALGIVRAGGGMTGAAVVRAMTWNVPFASFDRIPVLQRSLIVGEGLAVLDHLLQQGALARAVAEDGARTYRACVTPR